MIHDRHLHLHEDDVFQQVVKSGAGLAFVSYPEVLAKFDFAPQVTFPHLHMFHRRF